MGGLPNHFVTIKHYSMPFVWLGIIPFRLLFPSISFTSLVWEIVFHSSKMKDYTLDSFYAPESLDFLGNHPSHQTSQTVKQYPDQQSKQIPWNMQQ